jgi:transglutaminase-like putative cysteine protease
LVNGHTCRDFSHIGIAFCRALNIPARQEAKGDAQEAKGHVRDAVKSAVGKS